jgi:DUF1009 family protein
MPGATLGIIAGGGDLPRAIAETASASGRKVFILALRGSAEPWVESHPHVWVALGETGKAFKSLREAECGDVLLVGQVERPKFSEIKLDAKSILLAPRVMAAALKGDDALLRSLVDLFEREGFRAVSAAEAAPGLVARAEVLGRIKPNAENNSDIVLALKVVRAMGALDVGQAAIVCNGLTLSVEAAEGTDAMIARIVHLPEHIRGTPAKRRGVLVKAPKPIQDRKTDLPVIGVKTIVNVASVGLAGIAVEAGGALIVDRSAVAAAADAAGVFVVGLAP